MRRTFFVRSRTAYGGWNLYNLAARNAEKAMHYAKNIADLNRGSSVLAFTVQDGQVQGVDADGNPVSTEHATVYGKSLDDKALESLRLVMAPRG